MPVLGPMRLLKETRLNHLGKLAFRWAYWNMLLPGRPLPIPAYLSMRASGAPLVTNRHSKKGKTCQPKHARPRGPGR